MIFSNKYDVFSHVVFPTEHNNFVQNNALYFTIKLLYLFLLHQTPHREYQPNRVQH